jgi:hypothetical protein
MRTPVYITTDFPTVEEVAEELGVPPSRTRKLVRLAEQIAARSAGSLKKNSNKKRVAKASRRKKK